MSSHVRRLLTSYLMQTVSEIDFDRRPGTTVVFAPHPDDETLACGGTIIKKIRAGWTIKIVFMTDGSASHGHLMAHEDLADIREKEALVACDSLGVGEDQIWFLRYRDTRLHVFQTEAMRKVMQILGFLEPTDIFIPYRHDRLSDHMVTNQIVRAAAAAIKKPVAIYEYPVWYWYQWPWIRLPQPTVRETLRILQNTFAEGGVFRLIQDFRHAVAVSDVLDQKEWALEQHRSQMTRRNGDSRWLTLKDVSSGDFLACFFQPKEIFHLNNGL